MNIGNKEYFTIGEVSELTGIKETVLRFWEKEFSQLKPIKSKFGHRMYTRNDIEIILKIKELLYEKKMTIKGAREALNNNSTNKKVDLKIIKKGLEEMLEILQKKREL
ncbi:MAG TPA: MerR family transcriptional regulator [Spirochaetota bacterium]|nr:MerR family transcriptional regulator [Spirochaetota bacterium]HOL56670.1 MerR family transcriptional regulator [Spirochaetota bacterium]HPP03306.1 MerR family transcriptional regulator [Spirochaetota bacterium]